MYNQLCRIVFVLFSSFLQGKDPYLWLDYNGGNTTFEKYKKLSVPERKELLFWLISRELIKDVSIDTPSGKEQFTLCHSYYLSEYEGIPYSSIPYDVTWDIVWKSMFRENWDTKCDNIYEQYGDRVFVTGHVPVQRIMPDLYLQGNSLPLPILKLHNR